MTKEQIIKDFEANFLDGDHVSNRGLTKFYVDGALEIANHFYELGKEEGRLSESQEEREAWDRYAAAGMQWNTDDMNRIENLAIRADAMLSERRKRFGGKE